MPDVPTTPEIERARGEVIAALLRVGELCIGNLDNATPESLAETDRALDDARFSGIVLNELLLEEAPDGE